MSILRKVARPLLACPFVVAGIDALARPSAHRERAQILAPAAGRAGIELDEKSTDLSTRALGAAFLVAGAALATSRFPRVAAGTLATLNVPVALANAPFWKHEGCQRLADLANLATSAGLTGGALLAAGDRENRIRPFRRRLSGRGRHDGPARRRKSARTGA